MDWACFVNSRDLKIMTELITPMGYSLYQHLFQVSERYLCYVNGIMFINLCGCFSTFFTRSVMSCAFLQKPSLIDAYRNGIDPEIVQIMKELYRDDYHRFDHKTEKRANSILKNVLIKPVIKDVLRVKCCRWDVEQLTEKLDKNDAEMKALADQIQKLLDEQPKIVKLSEILSIKVDLLDFFARQKAYLHVPRKAYLQIGEIFEKNGLPSGEKDRLIGARQKSIQRRMSESLILLGKAIKSLNAETTVKVCLLFVSHIKELVSSQDSQGVWRWIDTLRVQKSTEASCFLSLWDKFMSDFGCRNEGELDVGVPRFAFRCAIDSF